MFSAEEMKQLKEMFDEQLHKQQVWMMGKFQEQDDRMTREFAMQNYYINSMGERIKNDIIESVDKKIDKVERKLSARIDEVDRKLTARIDEVDHRLTARIDALDKKIDEVDHRLTARIDALDKKIDEVDHRLTARIDALDKKIDEVDHRLTARIDALDKKIDTGDRKLTAHIDNKLHEQQLWMENRYDPYIQQTLQYLPLAPKTYTQLDDRVSIAEVNICDLRATARNHEKRIRVVEDKTGTEPN